MNFPQLPVAGMLPGGGEWIWILAIVVLLFGGAKLPGLAKGLGQSVKEFKKAQKDDDDEKPAAEAKKPVETTKPGPN